MKKEWYIQPRLIIDREKYKGKGRPKRSDYRIYPDPKKDMQKVLPLKLKIKIRSEDMKGWVGSQGI